MAVRHLIRYSLPIPKRRCAYLTSFRNSGIFASDDFAIFDTNAPPDRSRSHIMEHRFFAPISIMMARRCASSHRFFS